MGSWNILQLGKKDIASPHGDGSEQDPQDSVVSAE